MDSASFVHATTASIEGAAHLDEPFAASVPKADTLF
jgi:hypothetical protein